MFLDIFALEALDGHSMDFWSPEFGRKPPFHTEGISARPWPFVPALLRSRQA